MPDTEISLLTTVLEIGRAAAITVEDSPAAPSCRVVPETRASLPTASVEDVRAAGGSFRLVPERSRPAATPGRTARMIHRTNVHERQSLLPVSTWFPILRPPYGRNWPGGIAEND